jgi:hypothetical protein
MTCSKLRSGLKCLPDLIVIACRKRAVLLVIRLLLGHFQWVRSRFLACLEFIQRKLTRVTRCHVLMSNDNVSVVELRRTSIDFTKGCRVVHLNIKCAASSSTGCQHQH